MSVVPFWRLSDGELEALHRRTERRSWPPLIYAIAAGLAFIAVDHFLYIGSVARMMFASLVLGPLFGWSFGLRLLLSPMRWVMDRRGINWDHP